MTLKSVVLLLVCALAIHTTKACSPPIGPIHKSFREEFSEAKTVVKVRFDSISRLPRRQTNTYKVSVKAIYKGCVPGDGKTLYISTGSNPALCGSHFPLSRTYIMMLGDTQDVLRKSPLKPIEGYYVNLFTFYRRGSGLSKGQKRFLKKILKLEENKCT